jgi:hypothetical protein
VTGVNGWNLRATSPTYNSRYFISLGGGLAAALVARYNLLDLSNGEGIDG